MPAYDELLRPLFAGRRVLLAAGPVPWHTGMVTALRALGADSFLVVGSPGLGAAPEVEVVLVDVRAADSVDEFRQWERIADSPPPEVQEAVDGFDPELVLLPPFHASRTFAGRPAFGARRPEWLALEDKTTVDALWDEIGVPRPPSELVPVEDLVGVPHGTVWSGDASEGFNGGAVFVHWVRDERDAAVATERFRAHCRVVRVTPFLEGLPCSIHGMVTDRGFAVFRPVEMVVLRATVAPALRYAGAATTWDAPPAVRDELRAVARLVGEALAERVGYRGVFGIDGILTADGFRPTELNPRIGAGLRYATSEEHPLVLLNQAVIERAADVDPVDVEARILEIGGRDRVAGGWTFLATQLPEAELDVGCAKVVVGRIPSGTMVRVQLDPADVPAGQPCGPIVAEVLTVADAELGLGLGPVSAASPV